MASDDVPRRAVAARPRHLPATPGPSVPVAEEARERRLLLLLLAAVPALVLGGCDFGGDEDEDEDEGDEDGDD